MHYVCSDIHGQYELYKKLMEELNLTGNDTLYVLGDAIDRGPGSIPILQDMMKRENVVLFLGNHELMMLDHIHKSGRPEIWFSGHNGGKKTMSELKKLNSAERNEIIDYVEDSWLQMYLEVDGEKYALHHSYFVPWAKGTNIKQKDVDWRTKFNAVWNSPYRFWEYVPLEAYQDGYIHIAGHIPVQHEGKMRPPLIDESGHFIDIDGGCAYISFKEYGGLYCMSLEKDENGNRKEFWICDMPEPENLFP